MPPTERQAHRPVRQAPRRAGHPLQPSWYNANAFEPRISELIPLVRDRHVLDVGCTSGLGRPDWIHAAIARASSSTVGVDIDAEGIQQARDLGYDVRSADAEVLDVDGVFDVVHAGELIEHLDNPRAFLAACRRRLDTGGTLVLTTPNVFAISNFIYRIGGMAKVNADHTCWYCEDTLTQLLERNGFEVMELRYLRHESPNRLRSLASRLVRAWLPDRLAWNTLLAVARVAPSDG